MRLSDFDKIIDDFKTGLDVLEVANMSGKWETSGYGHPKEAVIHAIIEGKYRIKPREDKIIGVNNTMEQCIDNAKSQLKARFGSDFEITVKEKQREDGWYPLYDKANVRFARVTEGKADIFGLIRLSIKGEECKWFPRIPFKEE